MSLLSLRTFTNTMIVTGILLLPTVVPHAVQDLQDLKTVIDVASTTIDAAPNNSSWGFFNPAAPAGVMGTADLITNITTTLLRAQYLLSVDKVAWTTPSNTSNGTTGLPPTPTTPADNTTPTPTTLIDVPNNGPAALPAPPITPPSNISLDDPYLAYISSVPNFAAALSKLGRAWHKELNKPVWDAIDALQQTVTSFSSSMLSADLIHSQAVLRTIRVSSSLEDAQTAWSKLLNFPGGGRAGSVKREVGKVAVSGQQWPSRGRFYSHEDLWGRSEDADVEADYATVRVEEVQGHREARRFTA